MILLKVAILLSLIPDSTYAGSSEAINHDYQRIVTMKKAANPKLKDLDQLIAEKDVLFLKKIKKRVPIKELEIISQDLKIAKNSHPKNVEKAYLAKLEAAQVDKLSPDNQEALNDLIDSSNTYLAQKTELSKVTIVNADNQVFEDESAALLKKHQEDALFYSKIEKSKLAGSDKDSLFKKISKAYQRNLEKVIVEDNEMVSFDQ